MGGIIAVHRKVAPAPQRYASAVDAREETRQAGGQTVTAEYTVPHATLDEGIGTRDAGGTPNAAHADKGTESDPELTPSARANTSATAQRRTRRRQLREYYRNNPRTEYVVCVGNAALLGVTTLTLDPRLNLQNLRIIFEELSEKNDYNRKIYPQEGKFLFLLPDGTPCPRAWEYDSCVTDVCWSVRGGPRIVVVSDMPSKHPGDADSEENEKLAEHAEDMPAGYDGREKKEGVLEIANIENASTASSPPSIMMYPLLTPSGTHTHTATSGGAQSMSGRSNDSDDSHGNRAEEIANHLERDEAPDFEKSRHDVASLAPRLNDQPEEERRRRAEDVTLRKLLVPMDSGDEVEWRRRSFHEGTRQKYWDKFDAWAMNPGKPTCDVDVLSPTPTLGILIARSGAGKTSIACQLAKIRSDTVVAMHLCRHDYALRNDAGTMIRSISFQLSQRAPDGIRGFRDALWSGLNAANLTKVDLDGDSMTLDELFHLLILGPLASSGVGIVEKLQSQRKVILIDAVDESPAFLKCLRENARHVPSWIGFFVTARPGNELLQKDEDIAIKSQAACKTGLKPSPEVALPSLSLKSFIPLSEENNAMDVRVVIRTALQNSAMFSKAGGEATATISTVQNREEAAVQAMMSAPNPTTSLADTDLSDSATCLEDGDVNCLGNAGDSSVPSAVSAADSATDALLDEAVAILWNKSDDLMLCASYISGRLSEPPRTEGLDDMKSDLEESNGVTQASIWDEARSSSRQFQMSAGTLWLKELSTYPDNMDAWYSQFAEQLFVADEEESDEESDDNNNIDDDGETREERENVNEEDERHTPAMNPCESVEFRLMRVLLVTREPIHIESIESMLSCSTRARKRATARLSLLYPIRPDKHIPAAHQGFEDWLSRKDRSQQQFYIDRDRALEEVTEMCLRLLKGATVAALSQRCAMRTAETLKRRQARIEAREKEIEEVRLRAVNKGIPLSTQIDESTQTNRSSRDGEDDSVGGDYGDEEEPINWKDESHFFALRNIYPYLIMLGRVSQARDLLLNFDWLLARCVEGPDPFALLHACEHILRITAMRSSKISLRIGRPPTEPTDPALELIAGALRLSLGALYRDPWQLPSQIVGRLLSHAASAAEIGALLERASSWRGKFPRDLCDDHLDVAERVHEDDKDDIGGNNGSHDSTTARVRAGESDLTLLGEGLQGGWWCPVSSTLDSPGGPLLCTLTGHEEGIVDVSWCPGVSPDGSASNIVCSTGRDQTVRLWNLDGGPSHQILRGGHDWVDPDSRTEGTAPVATDDGDESGAAPGVCAVNAIAWHPDGQMFCTAGDDGVVCVWDTAKGECMTKLKGHGKRVVSVEWSDDGECVVTGSSDWTVRLWRRRKIPLNCAETNHDYEGQGYHDSISDTDCAFGVGDDHDGSETEYAESESEESDYDEETGRSDDAHRQPEQIEEESALHFHCTLKITGHTWRVNQATLLSADASVLASASDDETIRIWTVAKIKRRRVPGRRHRGMASYSHTCEHVLRGHDGTVRVLAGSPLRPNAERDSPKRLLASGGGDSTVRIWNPYSGSCMRVITRHTKFIMSLKWSADASTLVTSSWDQTVCVWDTSDWSLILLFGPDNHGNDVIMSVCWAPGAEPDRLITAGLDKKIRVWDLVVVMEDELERRRKQTAQENGARDKELAPERGEDSDDATCIDTKPLSAATVRLSQHKQRITCVKWSPDGTSLCSASADWSLRIWDTGSGRCKHVLRGHTGSLLEVVGEGPRGAKLCPGKLVNTTWVWNAALDPPAYEKRVEGHSGSVTALEWSPDGTRVASGGCDGQVRVWDACSGRCLQVLEGHRSNVSCLCWSPDSIGMCSGSADRTLRVWIASKAGDDRAMRGITDFKRRKAASAEERPTKDRNSGETALRKEEPGGSEDADGGQAVREFDFPDDSVCVLTGHLGLVNSVAWSPEVLGKVARVCSGSTDWSVRVWNLETAVCTHVLDGHTGTVTSATWSGDARRIASVGADGSLRVWRIYNRTFRLKQVLGGRSKSPHFRRPLRSVCWSSDNVYLCAGTGTSDRYLSQNAGRGESVIAVPAHSVMVWEPSRLVVLSPEDEKQAERLKRHRIRHGEKELVSLEEEATNRVGGLGAPLLSQSANLPRRWRAHFVHAQNDAPEECVLPTDATIGFSDDYDRSQCANSGQSSLRVDDAGPVPIGSGLHVCAFDPRRAFKLSLDTKTLHILRRVGGNSSCPDCEY